MQGSRVAGTILVVVAVVAAVLYIWGLTLQSYWALAIVVTIGFFAVLGLLIWVGITLLTARVELPEPTSPQQNKPERPTTGPEH